MTTVENTVFDGCPKVSGIGAERQPQIAGEGAVGALGQMIVTPLLLARLLLLLLLAANGQDVVDEADLDLLRVDAGSSAVT